MSENPDPRELKISHNGEAHRFEAEIGGQMAVAQYRINGNNMVLHHTEVPEAFRGKKIAEKLVGAALCSAREKGYKVIPECSYVATFIRRHPEYADLIDQG